MAADTEPGLVLADIQLADDSSGIDAVSDILSVTDVPVIFITAFPERLLTGQRPEPAFLITKPFQQSTLKASIAQALSFLRGESCTPISVTTSTLGERSASSQGFLGGTVRRELITPDNPTPYQREVAGAF